MFLVFKKLVQFFIFFLFITCFTHQVESKNLDEANPQTLSFVGGYIRNHPTTHNVFLPFLNQVEQDLNKKIKFAYFATNELYPESETYAVFEDGRVDFGVIRPGLFTEKMPLNTVLFLPNMAPNALVGSLLAQDIARKFPEIRAEFPKNSELFALWTSASYQLHAKTPIRNLDAIKGKKIIIWERPLKSIIEKLGGIPIETRTSDAYGALKSGKADGILAPIAPIRSFKISEVATYHLILNMGVTGFSLSCYKPTWDSFSPEVQHYFKSQGGALFSFDIAQSIETGALADRRHMQNMGQTFDTLGEADREKLADLFASSHQEWVQSMPEEKRAIAQEILDYTIERASYYKETYKTGAYDE